MKRTIGDGWERIPVRTVHAKWITEAESTDVLVRIVGPDGSVLIEMNANKLAESNLDRSVLVVSLQSYQRT